MCKRGISTVCYNVSLIWHLVASSYACFVIWTIHPVFSLWVTMVWCFPRTLTKLSEFIRSLIRMRFTERMRTCSGCEEIGGKLIFLWIIPVSGCHGHLSRVRESRPKLNNKAARGWRCGCFDLKMQLDCCVQQIRGWHFGCGGFRRLRQMQRESKSFAFALRQFNTCLCFLMSASWWPVHRQH